MKLKYPRRVRFRCEKCALCCGDTKDKARSILLLRTEAYRISEKTSVTIDKYAEKIEGLEPYSFKMRKTENGKCIFLEDNSCSIYKIRPIICRFYPFELKNLGNNKYAFAYTDECPGIGEGHELKKDFFKNLFDKFKESIKENIK